MPITQHVFIRKRYPPSVQGYVKVQLSDGRTEREHRFVVSQMLGRDLEPWEIVRHLDGDRSNNDLANLLLEERGEQGEHRRTPKMVFLVCSVCRTSFPRLLYEVQRAHARGRKEAYCSKKCSGKRTGRGLKRANED
jgi:hypothetical protein